MSDSLHRLYPPPVTECPLEGCFLGHDLRRFGRREAPFVYANFVASLDGRIAQPDPHSGRRRIPPSLANPRDWRLFMELAAQADCLLVSPQLLRAMAHGRYRAIADFSGQGLADLVQWRRHRGLVRQPALAAVSRHGEVAAGELARDLPLEIVVVTTGQAPTARIQALERDGVEVVQAGTGPYVDGATLVQALGERGHRLVYCLAGPRMLHTLVAAGCLHRLYLTLGHRILGGEDYDTLARGPDLEPPAGFTLNALYLDPEGEGGGQQFQVLAANRP